MFVLDFNCTSSNSSLTNTDYADMSLGHIRSHDRNSNFMYVDMTGSSLNSPYTEMSRKDSGYIDMTVGSTSPKYHGESNKQNATFHFVKSVLWKFRWSI